MSMTGVMCQVPKCSVLMGWKELLTESFNHRDPPVQPGWPLRHLTPQCVCKCLYFFSLGMSGTAVN